MSVAVFSVTEEGLECAGQLVSKLPGAELFHCPGGAHGRRRAGIEAAAGDKDGQSLRAAVADAFTRYRGLVFVMATGIAVRMIAPLEADKHRDPAVVVLDDFGRYAVSLLSGHEGGANRLTYHVAAAVGAVPVISTGTETNKTVVLGIGCRRGVRKEDVLEAVNTVLGRHGICVAEVRTAATAYLKYGEKGLTQGMETLDIPLRFIHRRRIDMLNPELITSSPAAVRQVGLAGVAEPCALLAADNGVLIQSRTVVGPVTVALVRERKLVDLEELWV